MIRTRHPLDIRICVVLWLPREPSNALPMASLLSGIRPCHLAQWLEIDLIKQWWIALLLMFPSLLSLLVPHQVPPYNLWQDPAVSFHCGEHHGLHSRRCVAWSVMFAKRGFRRSGTGTCKDVDPTAGHDIIPLPTLKFRPLPTRLQLGFGS